MNTPSFLLQGLRCLTTTAGITVGSKNALQSTYFSIHRIQHRTVSIIKQTEQSNNRFSQYLTTSQALKHNFASRKIFLKDSATLKLYEKTLTVRYAPI